MLKALDNTLIKQPPSFTTSEMVDENEKTLRSIFQGSDDVKYRIINSPSFQKALIVFIDGFIDNERLETTIIKPYLTSSNDWNTGETSIIELLEQSLLTASQIRCVSNGGEVVRGILNGQVALFIQGDAKCLLMDLTDFMQRAIGEPPSEAVIRGPREGFTENIKTNTVILRRKIKTPSLKLETLVKGDYTKTTIIIGYIQDIADPKVVEEVRKRVGRIEIDGILESGYVEELIEDTSFSPFPQIQNTERPDVVAANLLEGKVTILVDGTPFALLGPMTFWGAMSASEDYYERFILSTAVRWVRLMFSFIALLFPSIYVAISTFHQEMLPTNLLLSVAAAREISPFPALIEALIMEVTFEALREAGVRLPRPVGQAVSIVGGLVIGQSAVQAGIISAPMVIIVSITGIASFTMPRVSFAAGVRLLRFPMIIFAGTFGLYGIAIGLLALLIHLTSLESFGVPYFAPVAPFSLKGLKDSLIRAPWWSLKARRGRGQRTY